MIITLNCHVFKIPLTEQKKVTRVFKIQMKTKMICFMILWNHFVTKMKASNYMSDRFFVSYR